MRDEHVHYPSLRRPDVMQGQRCRARDDAVWLRVITPLCRASKSAQAAAVE